MKRCVVKWCALWSVTFAVSMVNAATRDDDEASLVCALQLPYLRLNNVVDSNAAAYLRYLSDAQQSKMVSMMIEHTPSHWVCWCSFSQEMIRAHKHVHVGTVDMLSVSTTYVDAAYCYRPSIMVCRSVNLSVCQLVCHTSEPCKNG